MPFGPNYSPLVEPLESLDNARTGKLLSPGQCLSTSSSNNYCDDTIQLLVEETTPHSLPASDSILPPHQSRSTFTRESTAIRLSDDRPTAYPEASNGQVEEPSSESLDRGQTQVFAGRASLRSGLPSSSPSVSLNDKRPIIGQASTRRLHQPLVPSHLSSLPLVKSFHSNSQVSSLNSSYITSLPSTSILPSLPPSLLPPNHPPQLPKYKRKQPERPYEPSTSQVQDDSIRQKDDVDSPGRPSSTSSLPTDSTEPLIHAPAPQRIHALSRRAPAIAPRFLASAPESDGAHEGVERGWSTAPSILGPGTGCPSTPGIPSPRPYHLREPHVPKRLKNRRVAPERSSFPKSVPQPSRAFLLPKQPKELRPQAAARGVSDVGVEILHTTATHPDTTSPNVDHCGPCPKEEQDRRQSPALVSTPPSVASDDSVLDNFVVEAAAAYASATQMPNSCGEVDTTERGRKLCSSFLHVFKDLARYRIFLQHRDEHAQNLIDSMQKLLDSGIVEQNLRAVFVVALSRLCRKSELYPNQFFLHDVIRRKGAIAEGAFGVIEKGYLSGKSVCIKILRMKVHSSVASDLDVHSFRRALSREIVPWAHMSHENILPFLGIIRPDDDYESLAIVSPFLKNGNVVEFLKRNPDADRPSFILGVASGMSYLHDNGIVHGDIKGQNVLVTDTNPPRACLADFGFTTVTDKNAIRSEDLSSGPVEGGTTQFEAPELFDPDIAYQRTPASDVYAFAMTCYGILTGNIPYPDKRDMQVMLMVRLGTRPPKPVGQIYQDRGLTASLWKLMENAWSSDPCARPRASEIVNDLLKESRFQHIIRGCGWGDLAGSNFPRHQQPQQLE